MKRIAVLLAVIALLAGCSQKADTAKTPQIPTIKVGTDSTFPPMEFIDLDSKAIVGFDVELLNAIGADQGFKTEFQSVAWDGIFAGLENGNYDMIASSVSITDDRKLKFDFTDPYVTVGQVVVVPTSDNKSTKLTDFIGKEVGVQQGTTGDQAVQAVKGVKTKAYQDIGLAFKDLVNGNIPALVIDSPVAADYALRNQDIKGKAKIVGDLITSEPYGYCLKKAGNPDLLAKLNKGLADLKASGKLDELKAKWGLK